MDIIKAILKLSPAVVDLVEGLIASGKTPDEAAEIVDRDIKSLAERYRTEKAEDERRLRDKHGR